MKKKILCIHGIGGKDDTMNQWSPDWKKAIAHSSGFDEELDFLFLKYDDLFTESKERMGGIEYLAAIRKFISSWVSSSIEEHFTSRGIFDSVAWYAGMPAQFATDEVLRKKLQALLKQTIDSYQPDVIFAHSLGTLICYDYLRQQTQLGNSFNSILVTAGSQIGHPALRKQFGGKILPLSVRYWVNFHNENDKVFASRSIKLDAQNYLQVETPFENESINHEALNYITHINAVSQGWREVLNHSSAAIARGFAQKKVADITITKAKRKPNRKALLIGINDYPDPENRLNGCVNDVFRISEVLQEFGFKPEEIRVALNERAKAKDIRERLDWLLGDAVDGDLRFFFYSGHGAQIPSSHTDYEIDSKDECLVPYDFDWTLEHAYTDKEFLELYSHLSFGVNFISIFDCCHSGGLTRDSGLKGRGLNPPDDVRHREIKWDQGRGMWIPRSIALASEKLFHSATNKEDKKTFTGNDLGTNKLGRAIPLWNEIKDYEKAKKVYGAKGPYIPVILQACQEEQSAYEYRHGVTSFGAFTFSLTTILRRLRDTNKNFSFDNLIKLTSETLVDLKYDQQPLVFGPKTKTDAMVPLMLDK